MASSTLISVNDYLKTSYRPDCDFVDGRIEERNAGEHDHAGLQAALILWFGQQQKEWNIEVLPEQRMQISPTRFRVPDVCLVSLDDAVEQILTKPPVACIEILSPEDTLRRMQERISDYLQFGVKTCGFSTRRRSAGTTAVRIAGWMRENSQSPTPQYALSCPTSFYG
jgi:Uma2 family endonuclease